MDDATLIGKLWDMANILTGFAVAQSIAITLALARREMKALKGALAHWITCITTLVFTGFYTGAIFWCGFKANDLKVDQFNVWLPTTLGRVGAVVLFALVLLLALLGHWQTNPEGGNSSYKDQ